MSYTELEHGYQDLRSTSRPIFYVGDINAVQPSHGDPAASSLYRSSKRGELSDGCSNDDGCMGGSDLEGEGKQVLVGICAMAKKSQSKPMKEILTRLEEFEYIKILVFPEEVILKEPVEDWPIVDCLISFHSKGFPLDKAIHYANLRNPFIINNLPMQYDIQDRRRVYAILDSEGIEIPRYAVLDRDSADPKHHELVESEDHVEVNGVTFNKPFVEKPVSAEDHNIYIYYPTSAGGGSQRLFRKIGSRSSVYSPESRVRKTGSYIYEDFMPTDGTDVKVYTVGPDYAHAEARKSPALDGKVERDSEGKEIRYPVILSNAEKLISRKVCLAFKQTVCGFDLLRANGKSFVCDVNGFSFVKNSNKYYDDCAKILGNMILRELAPTLHIPWSVPFQLDDPPIVPTTFGKMMELRCVVAVIRHGDRTPKQKMKVEVRHPKFFEIFAKYDGYKHGHVKLKRPKQLQEILDTARSLLTEIQHRAAGPELEEKQGKLEQLKSVLEMYGHFSGINRKVQMKYQPRGRPRGSSSDDGNSHNRLGEPSLVLILKWGGELTPAGRIQAEELGRIFRCMYPGGQGRHLSGEYAGAQGLGLLRLHSTFRHDLKIYASDEGRVQMTAAAFAKGLLALEGELTPILVQMVKSANTNGLLDNDCDSSKYQNMVKTRLHELLQQDREFTREDREQINPGNALSINDALDFVKNPVKCCQHVQMLIQKLMDIVRIKKDDPKTKDAILYHGETWELMGRRWGKIEKDFCTKNKRFDISKIPDIYDCIKYDLQHNNHTLQFDHAEELYIYAKYLADIVIPQEYGLTVQEKMTIGQGICTPLLKKIRADLQRNIEESGEETVNRLNPRYSHGVSSPGRHVRTRLYFTSESHVHSLLTVLRYGGLLDVVNDEQWRRAMEYVSMVSELNYMSQIVVMLYEDPTKDPSSEERFHVELHFSPGVNCCVQKNLPPGPGFRPHSRNESSHNLETTSQCSTRIEEEDAELGVLDDDATISPPQQSDSSPPLIETEEAADSTLDSPTTSRAIDMMDLDPNMMDEPYDSGFLQGSAPIPISARTVAGHEAARLGSQLAASQRQRREREASSICEPRARSYDHQRQEKPEKTADKLQYQSLDAVNKEVDRSSRRFNFDDSFYERVENLASGSGQSWRNSVHKYSPSGLGTASSLSLYASSPDLPDSLAGDLQSQVVPPKAQDQYTKPREKYFPPSDPPYLTRAEIHNKKSVKSLQELELNEDDDPWNFGESQLLEKSPSCEKSDVPVDRTPPITEKYLPGSQTDPRTSKTHSPKSALTDFVSQSESPSSKLNPIPSLKTIVDLKSKSPLRDEALDVEGEPLDSKGLVSSSGFDQSSGMIPQELEKMSPPSSAAGKVKRTTSELRDSSLSRDIVQSREGNRVMMTCSPSYLGIPVALPHSVSSPELPAPVIETSLKSSGALVVQPNMSLASWPSAQSPTRSGLLACTERAGKMHMTSCLATGGSKSCNLLPLALESSETKRYARSKSAALTLPTVNDARGEFLDSPLSAPRTMSINLTNLTNLNPPNERLPVDMSDCPSLCHHCQALKSIGHQCHDAKIPSAAAAKSLSRSNSRDMTFVDASQICPETDIGLSLDRTVSPTNPVTNHFPIDISNSQQSFCLHPKSSNSMTTHQCHSKTPATPARSMKIPFSQPNNRRGSSTVPETWDEGINDCDTGADKSSFICNCPHPLLSSSSTSAFASSSSSSCLRTIGSLSNPNSRRASMMIPESENRERSISPCPDCNAKSERKFSTSLPSRDYSYSRRTFGAQIPTYDASEFSDCRRSSLTVPVNEDNEIFNGNEDFLKREDRGFVGRSRSLSPCPQRCLCYNCNVAALIQQSVNLSPAERLNFQTYFVRSLSHKFSNCTCYRRSLESAEASRRVSRSTSPNSTGASTIVGPCSKSESNKNLASLHFHRKLMEKGRRLERRQSSPQNIGSSCRTSCCGRCKLHSDFVSAPKNQNSSLNNSTSSNTGESDSLGIVEKPTVNSVDSYHSVDQNGSGQGKKIQSSDNSFSNHITGSNLDSSARNSVSLGSKKSCNSDTIVGSIDLSSVDSGSREDSKRTQIIDSSSQPFSEIAKESSKVVPAATPSGIANTIIQNKRKNSSLFPLSRQLSCPEVAIDLPYPPGCYPMAVLCDCSNCTCEEDENLPNQSQQLESNGDPSMLRLLPPQQKHVRNLRRSMIREYCLPGESESSMNLIGSGRGHDEESKSSQDRQLPYCSDNNQYEKAGASSGDKMSSVVERLRKKGVEILLPRQFSCPEMSGNEASASNRTCQREDDKSMTTLCCEQQHLKSFHSPLSECYTRYYHNTNDNEQISLGARCRDAISRCTYLNLNTRYDNESDLTSFLGHKRTTHGKTYRIINSQANCTVYKNPRYNSSAPSLHPRLQTQRSFSSPDTRPSIIQEPDPTCTARRHRHSISGQMSYFKLLGYNVSKKLTGSANSLFSTAVISGSSSAPNLKDMVPPHASVVAAIEGFGGVPPIRPLETLHNALSLRQLDSFLDMMTSAPLFRTPASSPPKFPSPGGSIHGGSVVPNLSIGGINREYHSSDLEAVRYRKKFTKPSTYITPTPIHYKPGQDGDPSDLRNQLSPTSPNSTGWSSEPQSFLSSEPSSPAPTSAGECSMSMSLVSNDGTQPFAGPKFSTTPCLDLDFNDFCMSIDQDNRGESRGSISYTDYYSNEDGLIRKSGPDLAHLRERAARDDTPQESVVDEDEEHTLTLRQTEEQRKQDVKFIFEQTKDSSPNLVKPGSSFKKIGRFRVESMEISDEDVRIKEAAAAAAATAAAAAATSAVSSSSSNLSMDQMKSGSTSIQDKSVFLGGGVSAAQDLKKLKAGLSTPQTRSGGHRGKMMARSQSVSTPQNVSHKTDVDYTSQTAANRTGSFSTMSCEDLENWKATAVSPTASTVVSPSEVVQEEPILTVASSLKGTSNVTVGFNVQQDKEA